MITEPVQHENGRRCWLCIIDRINLDGVDFLGSAVDEGGYFGSFWKTDGT